jgi:hypothetical protein
MSIMTISGIYTEEILISSHRKDNVRWSRIDLGDVCLLVFSHDDRWPHVTVSDDYGENPDSEGYSVAEELENCDAGEKRGGP